MQVKVKILAPWGSKKESDLKYVEIGMYYEQKWIVRLKLPLAFLCESHFEF